MVSIKYFSGFLYKEGYDIISQQQNYLNIIMAPNPFLLGKLFNTLIVFEKRKHYSHLWIIITLGDGEDLCPCFIPITYILTSLFSIFIFTNKIF